MEWIAIAASVLASIEEHAVRDAPRECCGLLVGSHAVLDEAVATRNVSEGETRYTVDPAAHFALIKRLRGTGRMIVGAYHSHPRRGAEPSATDVAEALDQSFLYVIVSLAGGAPVTRAFRIADGAVTPVALVVQ